MNINVASSAGFCFGVRRAVEQALNTAQKPGGPVYMLGDIVHNEEAVEKIEGSGIEVKKSLDEIASGRLLIRAHGAKKGLAEEGKSKGLKVIDATCPMVTDIHEVAVKLEKQGYEIVIIGDHGHDEVVGIASQVNQHVRVVANPDEVHESFPRRVRRIGVIVQSTQSIENVQAIMSELVLYASEINLINTICQPTVQHQKDIRLLSKKNDVMIIIGSKTSANTMRMVKIATSINPKTYHVQNRSELNKNWFNNVENIGVSAGASTPDWVIEAVVDQISKYDPANTNVKWDRSVMADWPEEKQN